MDTAIVVFTRDLRLHDNPALHQACARARQVVPLFVADPAIDATKRSPNRARFLTPGLTVVPPGDLTPAGGGYYRVFTPYWRAWRAATWRQHCPVPSRIEMPLVDQVGRLPARGDDAFPGASPGLAPGGEEAGEYVRRYVPELSGLGASAIQTPWKLPAAQRERLGYPAPIVELS
jgi:deoxyribodipyrimidine photolyase